jgi:phosphatidate cytidylyltransferase
MTSKSDRVSVAMGMLLTGAVAGGLYFDTARPRVVLTLLIITPVLSMLLPLFRFRNIENAGLELMTATAGPFYVGGLFITSALMRRDLGSLGARWVLLTLCIAWFADTGAYFTGRAFGKAKLYPAVSPGKTRAGLYGALVSAAFAGVLASTTYLPSLPLVSGIVLGLVAGLLGQLGDLVESLLKRSVGVKDSGKLIPGHGGILDRVDALLFVSPVVYVYTLWFQP